MGRLTSFQKWLQPRVVSCAKVFDKEYGGRWPELINLETLDIADPHNCALGQVLKLGELRYSYGWGNELDRLRERYGDDKVPPGSLSTSEAKACWVIEINKRLKKRAAQLDKVPASV